MTVEKISTINNFEQNIDYEPHIKNIARLAISISHLTESFANVDRIPRYADGHRENDVEHSFMLAIAAPEMAMEVGINLDISKVRRFALVHDMLEIEVGDVATFNLTEQEIKEKELREQSLKNNLLAKLPAATAWDLEEYERQDTPEVIFVRMVDKLLPVAVDTTGQGEHVVMEDYGVKSYQDLVEAHEALHEKIRLKFGDAFPDLVKTHSLMLGMFEEKYLESEANDKLVGLKEIRSRGPIEIERKYRIDIANISEDLDLEQIKSQSLKQGYLAIGTDGSETRARSLDNERFELTVKSPAMIERKEQTMNISQEMFEELFAQTEGHRIEKTRYYIPFEERTIELDVYEGHLAGLVTAEVEFDGLTADASVKAAGFRPPEWFGEDISESISFKNHYLAENGIPRAPLQLGSKVY